MLLRPSNVKHEHGATLPALDQFYQHDLKRTERKAEETKKLEVMVIHFLSILSRPSSYSSLSSRIHLRAANSSMPLAQAAAAIIT